ncbi:MAG: histidine phosphatase family protein [Caulobacteraceae bacterium]
MRRLILFRHAQAEARAPSGEDFDRPLAPAGRLDAALMADVLAKDGLTPDVVLVSAARRTQETWACMAAAFPNAKVFTVPALYNASNDEIMAEVDNVSVLGDTLIVVAHNPGLQELAMDLLSEGQAPGPDIDNMAARFPTATAAQFSFDEEGTPRGEGVYYARDFGGTGE